MPFHTNRDQEILPPLMNLHKTRSKHSEHASMLIAECEEAGTGTCGVEKILVNVVSIFKTRELVAANDVEALIQKYQFLNKKLFSALPL